ncbi:MAG: hypothetical protein M3O02_07880 [Acidobacteriota bacterium]|nr:hypothetical protein [Acidobacteriota bacterium]
MLAEWGAECAGEDPVVVVPWRDEQGTARFIDLRTNPYDLYLIAEAEEHPALLQALRALNAGRSPVFTAKCDVWAMAGEELEALRLNLDADAESAHAGFASYIDAVWRERAVAASRHRQEQILDRVVRVAGAVEAPLAALECVLRPAVIDLEDTFEGYAITLYVKAAGSDGEHARAEWGHALGEVVKLLRGREFAGR